MFGIFHDRLGFGFRGVSHSVSFLTWSVTNPTHNLISRIKSPILAVEKTINKRSLNSYYENCLRFSHLNPNYQVANKLKMFYHTYAR